MLTSLEETCQSEGKLGNQAVTSAHLTNTQEDECLGPVPHLAGFPQIKLKIQHRALRMAPWVKHSTLKKEDLSSDSQNPRKLNVPMVNWEVETGDCLQVRRPSSST